MHPPNNNVDVDLFYIRDMSGANKDLLAWDILILSIAIKIMHVETML